MGNPSPARPLAWRLQSDDDLSCARDRAKSPVTLRRSSWPLRLRCARVVGAPLGGAALIARKVGRVEKLMISWIHGAQSWPVPSQRAAAC